FHSNEEVTNIEKICNDKFLIKTNSKIFTARFVILANGIFSTPESLNSNKVLIGFTMRNL
ncbi:TPA: NAD(P)-binding domain-containing protein, partial [Staphylococcus pseudintermedius]|nr:NAD(P)-binding domain-containing protein [Staphylococcus pseudintermedius]